MTWYKNCETKNGKIPVTYKLKGTINRHSNIKKIHVVSLRNIFHDTMV